MGLVPGRAARARRPRRRRGRRRRAFSRNEKYRRSNAVPDPPSRRTASSFGAKAARVRDAPRQLRPASGSRATSASSRTAAAPAAARRVTRAGRPRRAPRRCAGSAACTAASSGRLEGPRDGVADRLHLRDAHPARRHGRRSDPDARGDHRRARVERDRVLVHGQPDASRAAFSASLPESPCAPTSTSIRWLSVPPETRRKPRARQRRRERLRVLDDPPLVVDELRRRRLGERHGLGRDDVLERPALHAREDVAVEVLRAGGAAEDEAAARARAASCASSS